MYCFTLCDPYRLLFCYECIVVKVKFKLAVTDHRRVKLQTFNSFDSNEIISVALAMAPHKQTSGMPKYSN